MSDTIDEIIAKAEAEVIENVSANRTRAELPKAAVEFVTEQLAAHNGRFGLPFNTAAKLFGSSASTNNNFVYGLNRAFVRQSLPIHAGQRTQKNKVITVFESRELPDVEEDTTEGQSRDSSEDE